MNARNFGKEYFFSDDMAPGVMKNGDLALPYQVAENGYCLLKEQGSTDLPNDLMEFAKGFYSEREREAQKNPDLDFSWSAVYRAVHGHIAYRRRMSK